MPLFLLVFLTSNCPVFSQTGGTDNKIRIYSYPMDPRQHPDDIRKFVKPPDAETFGNRIQFMALRGLDGDYKKQLDDYTIKFRLGNIIWPSYPVLFQNNLPEVVSELKKRGLYLFDLWGYVPGSGPGGYWQQFTVPGNALGLFEKELGSHWLGMDNGEQDGRYIGGFASQLIPQGAGREQQYLNFQNHFQGLTDRLGNKMATLVSLNFGHYFLKEGVYTLIGAETAQGLPNAQVYYSFIRGAGKQYGVPWFGNASVWNRWGWKNYSGITDDNGGETKGTSLSLLKRLIYSHIMYNCVAAGFESSFLNRNNELSPIGKIQQSAVKWAEKYGNPGVMYTPVAVMLDFFSGWSFPRHLYTGNIYRVWGNLPYEDGDYLTDDILGMFYPRYQDASYFHDETGFLAPTPYGDFADCLLSDCPLWLMKQYPVIVIGGRLKGGTEIKDKLERYIEAGGHLVITAGSLENIPDGISGVSVLQNEINFTAGSSVIYNNIRLDESSAFQIKELKYPKEARVIAVCDQKPLVVQNSYGSGRITVFASPFGISYKYLNLPVSSVDSTLNTPFPLLNHVKSVLSDIFSSAVIFRAGQDLSLITCRKSKGDYTVAVCNNTWSEKPFRLTSDVVKILKITELPIDCSERKAVGFLPSGVSVNAGKNTGSSIAGGDIRIFSVKAEETNVGDIPFIRPDPNPVRRGLTLRNISSIRQEILLRPSFFQHFDRVVIDWKYLNQKEKQELEEESGWIRRQGLKLAVDLSSGINLFPDLRLVNNDSVEYSRSMSVIKSVIDKMAVMNAEDLIITSHRTIENNFTQEKFDQSLQNTLKEICRYALKYNININLRMAPGRNISDPEKAVSLIRSVDEPNLFLSPAFALMPDNPDEFNRDLELFKTLKIRICLVAAGEKDMYGSLWNTSKPVYNSFDKLKLKQLISAGRDCSLILDGIFKDQDEEYLDIKTIEDN